MNEYIIINLPYSLSTKIPVSNTHQTHIIHYFYWYNQRWHHETDSIVWSQSLHENIKTLIVHWFDLLREEQCAPMHVCIQSVLLSHDNHTAYVSFNVPPFNYNEPTITHLLFIKGLLRTLQENNVPLSSVVFLQNHAPMQHTQLDFSKSWSIRCLNQIPHDH